MYKCVCLLYGNRIISLLLLSYLIAILPAYKAQYENGSTDTHVGENG